MELGYAVVIPTFVLLDANLSPSERLLYGVLSGGANKNGYCTATNDELAKFIRSKVDGVLKQVNPESVSRMLKNLEELGYAQRIEQDGKRAILVMFQKSEVTVKLKEQNANPTSEDSIKVLEYLSKASITRGYRKLPFKATPANLKNINARLQDYHSSGDAYNICIGVINAKFQDDFFKSNPQYLNPETLFRPSKFDRYVADASAIKDVHLKVVTKTGLASSAPETAEELPFVETF